MHLLHPAGQVDRSSEAREAVVATAAEDVAFIQELVELVTNWLAGKALQDSALHLHGASTSDEDAGMLSGDESMQLVVAAAGAVADGDAVGGVQEQRDQLLLAPLNSYRRLLAFQELRKAQFGVESHPGFWVKKVRIGIVTVCWQRHTG